MRTYYTLSIDNYVLDEQTGKNNFETDYFKVSIHETNLAALLNNANAIWPVVSSKPNVNIELYVYTRTTAKRDAKIIGHITDEHINRDNTTIYIGADDIKRALDEHKGK